MCGIAGKWTQSRAGYAESYVARALVEMRRRGPDAKGIVSLLTNSGELVFGHTRLSIIDLSDDGVQPMWSTDGGILIVFNGEIYNYIELRDELRVAGHVFRTKTDTEVLLAAWQHWGIDCLKRFIGMFAFAVYDKRNRKLTCVRDAFGIKPFFYQINSEGFSFASDMLGIRALSRKSLSVDWQRAYDYLIHGDYDSTESTLCEGVKQLRPAHYLEVDLGSGKISEPTAWWRPSISQTRTLSLKDAAFELRERFLQSVRLHMRSDVQIGAALSGGVDSSSIVCAMRYVNPDARLLTFSYIADDGQLSEEKWVDQVNQYCNAIPHKILCAPEDLITDLDDLIETQGEPFGGTSIYAQYRVFKAAKEAGVKVTLDGQGADELLAGYAGYPGPRFRSLVETHGVSTACAYLLKWANWPGRSLKTGLMYVAAEYADGALYSGMRAAYGRSSSPFWINTDIASEYGIKLRQPRYGREDLPCGDGRRLISALASSITKRGLPSLLRHGDRNSMRFSVESRVPFLTMDLCDFLYSLPEEFLVSAQGETKHIFRAAMKGIVPDGLVSRKDKVGFSTPQRNWLKNEMVMSRLRDYAKVGNSLLNIPAIDRKLSHLGEAGCDERGWIWRVLNFLIWEARIVRG